MHLYELSIETLLGPVHGFLHYGILIYSKSPEEHKKHMAIVLETLRQEKLFAKLKYEL